jgi:hypothetical protein
MPPLDTEEVLPTSRVVRWVVVAGVVLFCAGLYLRNGLNVPTLGSTPGATTAPTPAR